MSSVSNPGSVLTEAQINALANIFVGEVPAGVINGVNTVFTTTDSYQVASTRLTLNGVLQVLGDEYTESADKEITFVNPPKATDVLFIQYKLL